MFPTEQRWAAVFALGLVVLGGLTLGPALWPRPAAPQITRQSLPVATVAAPEYPSTSQVTPLISGRLNLNTATQEQLEALPDIGPALAQRIIQGRPYRTLADLDAVKGIGPALLGQLGPLVRFE